LAKRAKYKPETYYQEVVRKYISKKCGCAAVRELNFGGPKFDVVGFSPDAEEFLIVECKRTLRAVGVGQTFGQIIAYKAMIYDAGETFLDAFHKKLVKGGISNIRFWAHAARFVDAGKIPVRFYVALLDGACERPGILQLIKRDLPEVGIIRVTTHDHCREYIESLGKKDHQLCEASRVEIPISMPVRNELKAVLEHKKSKPTAYALAAKFDSKITGLRNRHVRTVRRRSHGIVYRAGENFAALWPRQNHVTIQVKRNGRWKPYKVEKPSQLGRVLRAVKESLARLD